MRLSIIIPALDEAEHIGAVLAGLQAMRGRGVEVIVADGGSRDATVAIAEPLADRVMTASRGRATQMNAGAALATGEVLLFLHADTTLPADADRRILATLGPWVWGHFDVRITGCRRMLRMVAVLMNLRSRLTGIASGDQALFMTRAVFDSVGGFPDQPLMEDIELSQRLLRRSRPVCLHGPTLTSGRRWETRGVWRTIFLMWRLRWLYARGVAATRLMELYR